MFTPADVNFCCYCLDNLSGSPCVENKILTRCSEFTVLQAPKIHGEKWKGIAVVNVSNGLDGRPTSLLRRVLFMDRALPKSLSQLRWSSRFHGDISIRSWGFMAVYKQWLLLGFRILFALYEIYLQQKQTIWPSSTVLLQLASAHLRRWPSCSCCRPVCRPFISKCLLQAHGCRWLFQLRRSPMEHI